MSWEAGNHFPGEPGSMTGETGRLPSSRVGFVCLLLVALTLTTFWPATSFDFINSDDPEYFSGNPRVLGGLSQDNVAWAFSTRFLGNWFPLTWLSFLLDVTLFGPGPRGPHLVNLILHTVNSLLVLLVLRRMTGALWPSAVVAGLFALHPLRVESVAWVAGRKDVLSGLFFLLTLWAYARFVSGAKNQVSGITLDATRNTQHVSVLRPLTSGFFWLALFFFALGLMSKPMLVTLPFVLLLLDYWPLRRFEFDAGISKPRTWLPLLREKIPFLLLSAIFGVVSFKAQSDAGAVADWNSLPLAARIQNALVSYGRYLGKTFWPVDLAFPYPHPLHWPTGTVVAATLLLAGIFLGVLYCGRRRRYLLTGAGWFFGTLVPVIGIGQAGDQAMADRFTYLPAIGLFTGLVWAAADVAAAKRLPKMVLGLAVVAVLATCIARTVDQLRYWQNSETLFRHALDCTKGNFSAHNGLGLALAARGQWDEAIGHYELALHVRPGFPYAHNNLGVALAAQGRWDEAIAHYQQALQVRPRFATAHLNLGLAFAHQDRVDEAMPHWRLALEFNPDLADAEYNLGLALAGKGRWRDAMAHYQRALAIHPRALDVRNNFAWLLATCPDNALRNGVQAVELAREVDRRSGGKEVDYLDTLAAAYAEAGQFPQAVETGKKALALASAQTNAPTAAIRARLELYENGLPYREPSPEPGGPFAP